MIKEKHVLKFWNLSKSFFPLQGADSRYERRQDKDKLTLVVRKCTFDDMGMYSCEIQQYVKEGEDDQVNCWLSIEGNKSKHVLPCSPYWVHHWQ